MDLDANVGFGSQQQTHQHIRTTLIGAALVLGCSRGASQGVQPLVAGDGLLSGEVGVELRHRIRQRYQLNPPVLAALLGTLRGTLGIDAELNAPLPDGVACYAIAATTAPAAGGKLPGDGLVTVDSALGRHRKPELTLAFSEAHQWIGFGMGHLDLFDRPEVYSKLKSWLSPG